MPVSLIASGEFWLFSSIWISSWGLILSTKVKMFSCSISSSNSIFVSSISISVVSSGGGDSFDVCSSSFSSSTSDFISPTTISLFTHSPKKSYFHTKLLLHEGNHPILDTLYHQRWIICIPTIALWIHLSLPHIKWYY